MAAESTPTWLVGSPVPPASRIGTVLGGTYRLDAFLGEGETGINYNAWHLRQKAPFAIKLLRRDLAHTHDRVLKLRNDLRALSAIPGFLPAELGFTPDGAPYLASDLLLGETLRQRLARGPLPPVEACALVLAVSRTLQAAHQAGLPHGDLRPEHIFLPSQGGRGVTPGRPVLLDGGLHHLHRREPGLWEDVPLGKLIYLAPDQVSGESEGPDPAADQFALGAILYECLTGAMAFGGGELEAVLEKLSQPPPPITTSQFDAAPELLEALSEVVARACARFPADRFPGLGEMDDELTLLCARAGLVLPEMGGETGQGPGPGQEQDRAARRRTMAHKRIAPIRKPGGPSTPATPATPAVPATPAQTASAPVLPAVAQADPEPAPAPVSGRKARARATVKVRDLSKLMEDIRAGLDPEKAIAAALAREEESAEEEPEEAPRELTEDERLIEAGRAAVLARAAAAKVARDREMAERAQREESERREARRRVLESARAEVFSRMRADLAESEKARTAEQAARREAARREAERMAAEQAEAARVEAEKAAAARREAERAEAARREAEKAEAARIEAERVAAAERAAAAQEAEKAEAARAEAVRLEAARQQAEAERQRAEEAAAAARRQAEQQAAEEEARAAAERLREAELLAERARREEEARARELSQAREAAQQAELLRVKRHTMAAQAVEQAELLRAVDDERKKQAAEAEAAAEAAADELAEQASRIKRMTRVLQAVQKVEETGEGDLVDLDDVIEEAPAEAPAPRRQTPPALPTMILPAMAQPPPGVLVDPPTLPPTPAPPQAQRPQPPAPVGRSGQQPYAGRSGPLPYPADAGPLPYPGSSGPQPPVQSVYVSPSAVYPAMQQPVMQQPVMSSDQVTGGMTRVPQPMTAGKVAMIIGATALISAILGVSGVMLWRHLSPPPAPAPSVQPLNR